MNYILYDGGVWENLLPLTFTKPVADIRIGIFTIREKWEKFLRTTTTTLTEEYLETAFPLVETVHNIFINAAILPSLEFLTKCKNLKQNQLITQNDEIIAFYCGENQDEVNFDEYDTIYLEDVVDEINNTWDIFKLNEKAILLDFDIFLKDEVSMDIPSYIHTQYPNRIFIEEGATVNPCFINTNNGPVYIGKNATILDGAMISGPFALGNDSVVKMGAKIYGATTIGPNCKIGGELKNVVIFGNTNKGHEGYLGNSVIGEWCNFGADTNSSNLKNTLDSISLWSYSQKTYVDSSEKFLGLIMGDFSKTGINTMLNTGTVIGVSAHIFGDGFPEKFIPSFSWVHKTQKEQYRLEKAIETAKKTMLLANEEMSQYQIEILKEIFNNTENYSNDK